jgi:hypothetical protein
MKVPAALEIARSGLLPMSRYIKCVGIGHGNYVRSDMHMSDPL